MRLLKNLLFVGLLSLSAAAFAQADSATAPKHSPKDRAERLTKVISKSLLLSPEQRQEAYQINLKYAELNQQLKGDPKALEQNKEAKRAELQQLLNPAQYEKYLKIEEKIKERAREKKKARK